MAVTNEVVTSASAAAIAPEKVGTPVKPAALGKDAVTFCCSSKHANFSMPDGTNHAFVQGELATDNSELIAEIRKAIKHGAVMIWEKTAEKKA